MNGKGHDAAVLIDKELHGLNQISIDKLKTQLEAKQITQQDYDNAAEEEKIKRDSTIQELEDKFGFRNMGNGTMRAQSQCKVCR